MKTTKTGFMFCVRDDLDYEKNFHTDTSHRKHIQINENIMAYGFPVTRCITGKSFQSLKKTKNKKQKTAKNSTTISNVCLSSVIS